MTGLRFVAYGVPATKGSLKPVKLGKRIGLIESHTTSKPWREAVKWAALEAIAARDRSQGPAPIPLGPLEVDVVFSFAKPKSAPKTRRTWPITRSSGDIDKLARNLLDALVDAAVMADDSQVVRLVAEKAYVGEYPSGLASPGAMVLVRPLPDASAGRRMTGRCHCGRPIPNPDAIECAEHDDPQPVPREQS